MTEAAAAQVRAGNEGDLDALTAIYRHYVTETHATFDTVPPSPAERGSWLRSYSQDGPHRLLVALGETGAPLGYATSGPLRPKPGWSTSVEVTAYLDPPAVGRGVGGLLYEHLFAALAEEDVHRAYAAIVPPNAASVRLHTRFGFRHVGTFTQAGRKFGRLWDVAWYEKAFAC